MRLQFSLIKGPLRDPVPNVKFTEPGKLLSVVEALALYLFPDTEVRVAVSCSCSLTSTHDTLLPQLSQAEPATAEYPVFDTSANLNGWGSDEVDDYTQ